MFTYRSGPPDCPWAVFRMLEHSRAAGVDLRWMRYGNALIDRARNQAIGDLRPDAGWAFFVDDDMLMQPDALVRLLACSRPVVSAYCVTRPPVDLPFKIWDPAACQFNPLYRLKRNKLLVGQFALGAACLLMDRTTIDALLEQFLGAYDWLKRNQREHDRLHVRAEYREKERVRKEEIRRANWAADKYVQVFDREMEPGERRLGEDVCLSQKLIWLGVEAAIDTSTAVAHVGEYPYGPWDLDVSFEEMPDWLRPKVRVPQPQMEMAELTQ